MSMVWVNGPRRPRVIVLADTYRMALNYAVKNKLGHPGEEWFYVANSREMQGAMGPGKYVVVTNNDLTPLQEDMREELQQVLLMHGFEYQP